jgi:type IV secretory pathway TrbD component
MQMLSVNALCAGAGAGIGALVGAIVPLALAGFFVGFGVAVWFVARRFRDV